jgi:hypothetical protein
MATHTFYDVWYRPDERRLVNLSLLAYTDKGKLIVGEESLEFQGKKARIIITGVRRISYVTQGNDFINKWVKIEYGDSPKISTAFFADGSELGWGGVFGGSKRILDAVQHLAKDEPIKQQFDESPVRKTRHGCFTAWLILSLISTLLILIAIICATSFILFSENGYAEFFEDGEFVSPLSWPILFFGMLLNLVFIYALFRWKKWGFWGFVVDTAILIVFDLREGAGIGVALGGVMSIGILYVALQAGDENKGWPQLE